MSETNRKRIFEDHNTWQQAWCSIEDLVIEAHENAVEHGFYDDIKKVNAIMPFCDVMVSVNRDFRLAQLAKIAGEIGEAVEALQKDRPDDFREEIADIFIRTLDLAGDAFGPVDFAQAVLAKMEKNKGRPYKHGKCC